MNNRVPQRVTRGYAQGLVVAVTLFALALLVLSWGFITLSLDRNPVTTEVSNLVAPMLIGVCLVMLVVLLWRELIRLLQGNRPTWALGIVIPGFAYLIWCLLGTAFSFSIQETWVSPFVLSLVVSWAVSVMVFWWILTRKLYSGKGRPLWPWEKNGRDEGPDWTKDGDR